VYFGVQKWNARARATNFAVEELPELFSLLHLRGVKGFVTFNTLVFSNELEEAQRTLEQIVAAGPDAFILQDLGIARLIREMAPGVPLHASSSPGSFPSPRSARSRPRARSSSRSSPTAPFASPIPASASPARLSAAG